MGKGTHLSLFFVVMRGDYDALLPWPFEQKVSFKLIDQTGNQHIIESFRPDPNSPSFQRPQSKMNVASGCPLFVPKVPNLCCMVVGILKMKRYSSKLPLIPMVANLLACKRLTFCYITIRFACV